LVDGIVVFTPDSNKRIGVFQSIVPMKRADPAKMNTNPIRKIPVMIDDLLSI